MGMNYEVLATSFFLATAYMRAGGQSSPSPFHLPTDSVQSVYSSQLSWLRGAGGTEISNQIFALDEVWTLTLTIGSPAR